MVHTSTRKKTSKKAPKKAVGKVPDMKSVISANRQALKAEAIWKLSHKKAAADKKVWEGRQADLAAMISDAEKGQAALYA